MVVRSKDVFCMKRIIADTNEKLKDAMEQLRNSSAIALDTETSSLEPHTCQVWSIQLANEEISVFVPINTGLSLEPLKSILFAPDVIKIMHRASFDLKMLWKIGLDAVNIWCTRTAEQILTAGLYADTSLAGSLTRRLKMERISKDERKDFYDGTFEGNPVWTDALINYALTDVEYLIPLMQEQKRLTTERRLEDVLEKIEMPLVTITALIEYRGVKLDRQAAIEFRAQMRDLAKAAGDEVNHILREHYLMKANVEYVENSTLYNNWLKASKKMQDEHRLTKDAKSASMIAREQWRLGNAKPFNFPPKAPCFNPRSIKHIKEAFEAMTPSIDVPNLRKETLTERHGEHIVLDKLIEYKKYDKLAQMSEICEYLDLEASKKNRASNGKINPVTKRIHCNLNQNVDTGRYSSKLPNLQNIPARDDEGKAFRSLFVADSGNKFVIADFSAIELIIIGVLSNDKTLLTALNDYEDLHCYTISEILDCNYESLVSVKDGEQIQDHIVNVTQARKRFDLQFDLPDLSKKESLKDWVKGLRDCIKTLTYGIAYGLSPFGLSNKFHCDSDTAQGFIRAFFRVYSGIKRWLDAQAELGLSRHFSKTAIGRRRYYRIPASPTLAQAEKVVMDRLEEDQRLWKSVGEAEWNALLQEAFDQLNKGYSKAINRIRRQASNHVIQGSSADITKLSMIYTERMLSECDWFDRFSMGIVLTVHDELVLEVPTRYADQTLNIVKQSMEFSASDILNIESGTIVIVNPFIADYWRKN